jgi:uncharacterized protein (DUF58 family)
MRIVEGSPVTPSCSVRAAGRANSDVVAVPLDTSRRGEHPIGPYLLVHGDPWSVVRRIVHRTPAGSLTVLPRTYPVGRRRLTAASTEESMMTSRRPGDEQFHALRDYVLGDEPRMVHWRSSARVGHLVVRQQVAAAESGTTVVLDCDRTAYGRDDQFAVGWVSDRFEAAVEVTASIVAAEVSRRERTHLVRTTRTTAPVSSTAGSADACLSALAGVVPVPPVETDAADVPRLVRTTRCARVIVVTGTPHPGLLEAARRLRRTGLPTTLVRVGGSRQGGVSGLDVVDVDGPADLADPAS